MASPRSNSEKLAYVANLERTGLIKDVAISAFKTNCPFCLNKGSLSICLHSRQYPISYACSVCGEVGSLAELQENVKALSPVTELKARHKGNLNAKKLEGRE